MCHCGLVTVGGARERMEHRLACPHAAASDEETFPHLAAAILTADIFGDPSPAPIEALRAIAPIRQVLRQLKRGLI